MTVGALLDRLVRVERELGEVRRELAAYADGGRDAGAWARISEDAFARDWDNDLDAAYDRLGAEQHGAQ